MTTIEYERKPVIIGVHVTTPIKIQIDTITLYECGHSTRLYTDQIRHELHSSEWIKQ